jgi:CRISPR-associated protein Cas1
MQQMRGREGSRIAQFTAAHQKIRGGLERAGYDPDNFEAGDPVNKALILRACVSLRRGSQRHCVRWDARPAGIVHTGHDCSFVLDIAALYKAEITIPISFEVAAENRKTSARPKGACARCYYDGHILQQTVTDIHRLLLADSAADGGRRSKSFTFEMIKRGCSNGVSYGMDSEKKLINR